MFSLNNVLHKQVWTEALKSNTTNNKFNSFMDTLCRSVDKACPYKIVYSLNQQHNKIKWITKGIMKSRKKLRGYYHMKMYTNNPEFLKFYNKYKQIYKKVINASKAYDLEN